MSLLAWEQQPRERDSTYEYFKYYISMEPEIRSYEKVATAYDVSIQNIKQIGAKYDWVQRARLYDAFEFDDVAQREAKKLDKRRLLIQMEESEDYDKLRTAFSRMLDDIMSNPGEYKPSDIRNLMAAREEMSKFIRRAVEMPTGFRAMELAKEVSEVNDDNIEYVLDEKRGTTAISRLS